MDGIHYPRALNKPTYLFWKLTFTDIQKLFGSLLVAQLPAIFFDRYPAAIVLLVWVGAVSVVGCVIAVKPRGYLQHLWRYITDPTVLVPGHTFRRIFVVRADALGPKSVWQRWLDKLRHS